MIRCPSKVWEHSDSKLKTNFDIYIKLNTEFDSIRRLRNLISNFVFILIYLRCIMKSNFDINIKLKTQFDFAKRFLSEIYMEILAIYYGKFLNFTYIALTLAQVVQMRKFFNMLLLWPWSISLLLMRSIRKQFKEDINVKKWQNTVKW